MPKYTFECTGCRTQFTRTLKMGDHENHPCPSCGTAAPRYWGGQGFGFGFAAGSGAPGNTGVNKDDYPTADQAVGRSAEGRWGEYDERAKVKDKVREVGGTHALIRRHVTEDDGKPAVEYEAGGERVLKTRRKLVQEAKTAVRLPSDSAAR